FTLPLLLFCRTPPALSVLYTLSLHDALPIFTMSQLSICLIICLLTVISYVWGYFSLATTAIISMFLFMVTGCIDANTALGYFGKDRKSTRLNSSHVSTSYAVFCLKKKTPSSERPPRQRASRQDSRREHSYSPGSPTSASAARSSPPAGEHAPARAGAPHSHPLRCL